MKLGDVRNKLPCKIVKMKKVRTVEGLKTKGLSLLLKHNYFTRIQNIRVIKGFLKMAKDLRV